MKIKTNRISKIILNLFVVISISYFGFGVLKYQTLNFNEFQIKELGSFNSSSPPYQMITSLFLSGGIEHLLINLLIMMFSVKILLTGYKENCLIVGFILSGIVANFVSVYLNPEVYVYGLSGCVYGLLGMLFFYKVLLGIINIKLKSRVRYIEIVIYFIIIISFLLNIGEDKSINTVGHATGFCTGVVIGIVSYIITEWRKSYAEKRRKI